MLIPQLSQFISLDSWVSNCFHNYRFWHVVFVIKSFAHGPGHATLPVYVELLQGGVHGIGQVHYTRSTSIIITLYIKHQYSKYLYFLIVDSILYSIFVTLWSLLPPLVNLNHLLFLFTILWQSYVKLRFCFFWQELNLSEMLLFLQCSWWGKWYSYMDIVF